MVAVGAAAVAVVIDTTCGSGLLGKHPVRGPIEDGNAAGEMSSRRVDGVAVGRYRYVRCRRESSRVQAANRRAFGDTSVRGGLPGQRTLLSDWIQRGIDRQVVEHRDRVGPAGADIDLIVVR